MKNIKTMLQKRLKAAKNKKGFTLIEIIVVLVIMAVLLALTVPAITSYIEEANNAKYYTEARSVYVVAEAERARSLATNGTFAGTDGTVTADMLKEIVKKSGVDVISITYSTESYIIALGDGNDAIKKTVKVTINGNMEITDNPTTSNP